MKQLISTLGEILIQVPVFIFEYPIIVPFLHHTEEFNLMYLLFFSVWKQTKHHIYDKFLKNRKYPAPVRITYL